MRSIILSVVLILSLSLSVKAQFDFYTKSLVKIPKMVPSALSGEFVMKVIKPGHVYYNFSNATLPIFYYPPNVEDCGYFELFGKHYTGKSKYDIDGNFGCDLDGETFKAFQFKLGNRSYFIITSIANANGRGTLYVFCQLFDITDKKNIIYYPLWSIFGSHLSFGDYNGDGRLDFLEVRNERAHTKDDDTFKLKLKTLNKDQKSFEDVKGKYIIFHQEYVDNSPKITIIEKHW